MDGHLLVTAELVSVGGQLLNCHLMPVDPAVGTHSEFLPSLPRLAQSVQAAVATLQVTGMAAEQTAV